MYIEMEFQEKYIKTVKDYYQDPEWRAKHLAKQREKVECECGRKVRRGGLAKHKRTDAHRQALVMKNERPKQETVKQDAPQVKDVPYDKEAIRAMVKSQKLVMLGKILNILDL